MSEDSPVSPWRSKGFVVSAAVLAVIVLLGGYLMFSNLTNDEEQQQGQQASNTPAANPAPPATTVKQDAQASVCGLPGSQTNASLVQAPKATWTLFGTVAVPSSPTAGPGITDPSGLRRCYAHTPEGALFAAANQIAMMNDASLHHELARKVVVPGVGANALAASHQPSPEDDGTRMQVAGFRVVSYDGTTSTIEIAYRDNMGRNIYPVFTWDMRWLDGDWKFRVTDQGGLLSAPAFSPDLTGYTLWSGA